ncbi:MAG: methyltransferase domain-containing protein [Caldilineaceae bacterium]
MLDATDEAALRSGDGTFDAVSCQMALMDMPEIAPLMRAAYALLKPGGCFVFSRWSIRPSTRPTPPASPK